jgi:hypothetical protein
VLLSGERSRLGCNEDGRRAGCVMPGFRCAAERG